MADARIVPFDERLKGTQSLVMRMEKQIARALPQHMKPDRIVRMVLTALQVNPDLVICEQVSFIRAVMECCQAGLEPTPGQAYILPFGDRNLPPGVKRAVFIPDYRGLIGLARRSGFVDDVWGDTIYDVDKWAIRRGMSPDLMHEPNYELHLWQNLEAEKKAIKGFYAVGALKDTKTPHFEFIPKRMADATMLRSPGHGKTGPWVTDYVPMGLKTAIKRLMKFMPLSSEDYRLQMALARDDARDAGLEPKADTEILEAIAQVLPEGGKTTVALSAAPAPSKLDQMAEQVEQEKAEKGPGGPQEATGEALPDLDPGELVLTAPGEPQEPTEASQEAPVAPSGPASKLPAFNPVQKALYIDLMTRTAGSEEDALALLAEHSHIKPGGVVRTIESWEQLAEKGSESWITIIRRRVFPSESN